MQLEEVPESLRDKISLWLSQDRDENTLREVRDLCEKAAWPQLHQRFDNRIIFGTAGLRARMEAGFSRMNSLVVLQATQGLAMYIKKQFPSNLRAVVGHDHRFNSKKYAEIAATVFLEAGFTVQYLNPGNAFVHTPLVPLTVDTLDAAVGVMITASHNPKMDNGYKVYYSNGCQIIPPHDKAIAASIDENLEPWSRSWNCQQVMQEGIDNGKLNYVKEQITKLYIRRIQTSLSHNKPSFNKPQRPWFVYTPMHGVGYSIFTKIASQVMDLKENIDFICVPEQINPDPSFPTVSFPNPEEKGALDLAISLATKHSIDLVIANDPDADRFSAAVMDQNSGKWRQLTGNEIGILFAYYELQRYRRKDAAFKDTHPLAMLNSTVSSSMMKKMGEIENFKYSETLTGFKWIGNKAIDLEKKGYYVPFGYEEAIGYMFSSVAHDKDGISASVAFIDAFRMWATEDNMGPLDILKVCFEKYGVFREYNGYYILSDPAQTKEVFDYIRNVYTPATEQYPTHIGEEIEVITFRDLTTGYQSDTPNNKPNLPINPASEMITITGQYCGNESAFVRFTLRGSGTEPKLKVYIEAMASTEASAENVARKTWNVLRKEWFKPEERNLKTNF